MARPRSLPCPTFGSSFLSLNLICIFIVTLLSKSGHASSGPVPVTLPPTADPSNVVQDNFLGISFELSPFDTLCMCFQSLLHCSDSLGGVCPGGKTPQDMPKAMQNYLSNLRSRIKSPLRIRVGGNSMDSAIYVANQAQMIIVTDPNADPDDIPVDFGPVLFDVLNAMSNAVGEMQFVIGLSMRTANDTNAIELASDTRKKLGKRLDSMLMGNAGISRGKPWYMVLMLSLHVGARFVQQPSYKAGVHYTRLCKSRRLANSDVTTNLSVRFRLTMSAGYSGICGRHLMVIWLPTPSLAGLLFVATGGRFFDLVCRHTKITFSGNCRTS